MDGQPRGGMPVLAKPGTAVFFDRRIFHASSPNTSDVTRKVLFYGYSYRWLRPRDDMRIEEWLGDADPIQQHAVGGQPVGRARILLAPGGGRAAARLDARAAGNRLRARLRIGCRFSRGPAVRPGRPSGSGVRR